MSDDLQYVQMAKDIVVIIDNDDLSIAKFEQGDWHLLDIQGCFCKRYVRARHMLQIIVTV